MLGKGVKQVQNGWLTGKVEITRVAGMGFHIETLLLLTPVACDVALRDAIQLREQFDPHDAPKRIFGCHQQGTTLAGAEVDEGEPVGLNW